MIRPYHPDDTEQIVTVWRKASDIAHPFLTEAFLQKEAFNIVNIYLPNTITWVYGPEEEVQGFISMIDNEIGAIFVDPDRMKKGVGSKLLQQVQKDHPVLTVKVFEKNKVGRAFYQKSGFRQIGKELHDETGEMLLVLQLQ